MANIDDMRYMVDDTRKYPHMAIAYMIMQYPSDNIDGFSEYAATGFLCEDYTFFTAAHNVLNVSNTGRLPATNVILVFGLNGSVDSNSKKMLSFEGCKFTIPKDYQEPCDQYDIAWVNLQELHHRKQKDRVSLDWSLDDLPKEKFYSCAIPEEYGALKGYYYMCGKFCLFLRKYNYMP